MVIGNEEEGDVKNDCQVSGLLKQVDRGAISEKENTIQQFWQVET